jgi:hypothetical protein
VFCMVLVLKTDRVLIEKREREREEKNDNKNETYLCSIVKSCLLHKFSFAVVVVHFAAVCIVEV